MYPNIFWLVVPTPLKNRKVNWDDDIPNICESLPEGLFLQGIGRLRQLQRLLRQVLRVRGQEPQGFALGPRKRGHGWEGLTVLQVFIWVYTPEYLLWCVHVYTCYTCLYMFVHVDTLISGYIMIYIYVIVGYP